MFKVLIAYDGSDGSDRALRDLRRAGLPKSVEAIVYTVAPVWPEAALVSDEPVFHAAATSIFPAELRSIEHCTQEAQETAAVGASSLARIFPSWDIRSEAEAGNPAQAIMDRARSWNPDLVVLGTHGRSALGRALFGSVCGSVVAGLSCHLRIARFRIDEAVDEPLRILVAFDGSSESEHAFQEALRRDWPAGTVIRLVTVADARLCSASMFPPAPVRYWVQSGDAGPLVWVDRMLAHQREAIERRGYLAHTSVVAGEAKSVLLREAAEWGADTIFAGSRGLGEKEKILLGSVSSALAMRAHCSVEVVHESGCRLSSERVRSSETEHTGPLRWTERAQAKGGRYVDSSR